MFVTYIILQSTTKDDITFLESDEVKNIADVIAKNIDSMDVLIRYMCYFLFAVFLTILLLQVTIR